MLLKILSYKSGFTVKEKSFKVDIIVQHWCCPKNSIFFWTAAIRNDVGYLLNHCLMYVYKAGTLVDT